MKKVLYYLIPFLICAIIVVVFLAAQGSYSKTGKGLVVDVCNAFTLSGAMMTGVGLLVFVTNGGAFDMLAFGFIKLVDIFKKDLTKVKYRTFYDYRQAKSEKKRSFLHLLLIGLVYLAVALVLLIVYNKQ
ncbi:MAG: DUF3899 domain-containing protein [Corallococcus sp.]|nr:DUF3899 domain-containing protein [Corallococcus sp.]MCM1359551.1 DUF3899 domain-containing protein [Corallococcus sp.]MCM1395143.1 DUF3899 domain-containing protein [Corallococcus sp.]